MNYTSTTISRQSNIELLRILCMFSLVLHHCIVHGGAMNMEICTNWYISWLFLPIGKICFVAFVVISAWFMVDKPFKMQRFMKIWLQVLFYSVLFAVVAYLVGGEMTLRNWISVFFPISGNSHGFAAAYLAFFLTIPFLQKIGKNITKQQLLFLIAILLYFQVLSKGIFYVSQYTQYLFSELQLFILIFFIALYLKRFPIKLLEKKWFDAAVFFGIWVLFYGMNYLRFTANNSYIELFFSFNADESGLFYLIGGFALFFLFQNIKMPTVPAINTVATTTFGILLIHDHNFFRYQLWPQVLKVQTWYYSDYFLLKLFATAILVFTICAVIDYLRRMLLERPIFRLTALNRFCGRVDAILVPGTDKPEE